MSIRFIDVGCNLLDPMFQGTYRGTKRHAADVLSVLDRARAAGCNQIIVTAGTVEESRAALAIAKGHGLRCTVGIHPTHSMSLVDQSRAESAFPIEQGLKSAFPTEQGLKSAFPTEQGLKSAFPTEQGLKLTVGIHSTHAMSFVEESRAESAFSIEHGLKSTIGTHPTHVVNVVNESRAESAFPEEHGLKLTVGTHPTHVTDVLSELKEHGLKSAGGIHPMHAMGVVAVDESKEHGLKSTVGIHPTRILDVINELLGIVADGQGTVVAIGECGLDFDRQQFASMEVQRVVWEAHFEVVRRTGLPMFIHSRGCYPETIATLKRYPFTKGVVHSFDGTPEQAREIVSDLNLYIGLNGCSLRTAENLVAAKSIPLDRVLVESDAPWCEIKNTSAAKPLLLKFPEYPEKSCKAEKFVEGCIVRNRNEPRNTLDVLRVLSVLHERPVEQVAEICLANTKRLFGDGVVKG